MAGAALTMHALLSILRRTSRQWRSALAGERRLSSARATDVKQANARGHLHANSHLMAEQVRTWLAVYDPEHNSTHRLNSPAARVLALCDGARTTGAIAAELRRQLDVGAGLNDADVGAAVDLLVQKGLVTAETEPSGTGPDSHRVIAADRSRGHQATRQS